jgi:hypothetical protein
VSWPELLLQRPWPPRSDKRIALKSGTEYSLYNAISSYGTLTVIPGTNNVQCPLFRQVIIFKYWIFKV